MYEVNYWCPDIETIKKNDKCFIYKMILIENIENSSHLCTEISKICCNGPAELRFVSLMSRHG